MGLFTPLQRHYANGLDEFVRKGHAGMNKGEFLPFVFPIYLKNFSFYSYT